MKHTKSVWFVLFFISLITRYAHSTELHLGLGGGPQFGTDSNNQATFIDAIFYNHHRSKKQIFSIGSSITHLTTNSSQGDDSLTAFSIFPELKLNTTLLNKYVYFHVRALGPTYITTKTFGEREQAMHFAFQAQVGGGIYLDAEKRYQMRLLYRHFSNANLKQPNDGIDIPLMLSFGIKL